MISKPDFIQAISAIELQLHEDKTNAEIVAEVFGASEFNLYNNEKLINTIVNLLRYHFPKVDGFCEIEHFCHFTNFGKLNDESVGDFYDRLIQIKNG